MQTQFNLFGFDVQLVRIESSSLPHSFYTGE